jgi:hypothetical protein
MREERRIRRAIVGVVHAVRARAGHPDDAHLFRRQLQQLRERAADGIRFCPPNQTNRAAVAHVGHCAGRSIDACDWNGYS